MDEHADARVEGEVVRLARCGVQRHDDYGAGRRGGGAGGGGGGWGPGEGERGRGEVGEVHEGDVWPWRRAGGEVKLFGGEELRVSPVSAGGRRDGGERGRRGT